MDRHGGISRSEKWLTVAVAGPLPGKHLVSEIGAGRKRRSPEASARGSPSGSHSFRSTPLLARLRYNRFITDACTRGEECPRRLLNIRLDCVRPCATQIRKTPAASPVSSEAARFRDLSPAQTRPNLRVPPARRARGGPGATSQPRPALASPGGGGLPIRNREPGGTFLRRVQPLSSSSAAESGFGVVCEAGTLRVTFGGSLAGKVCSNCRSSSSSSSRRWRSSAFPSVDKVPALRNGDTLMTEPGGDTGVRTKTAGVSLACHSKSNLVDGRGGAPPLRS